MNTTHLSPDDPKLTAYALGELDPVEAARIAQAIQTDPIALAAVKDIQSLASQLEDALENEPIMPATSPELVAAPVPARHYATPKTIRFPIYWVSGLAAACLTIVLLTQTRTEKPMVANAPVALPTATSQPAGVELANGITDLRKKSTPPAGGDVAPSALRREGLKAWGGVADAGSANGPKSTLRFQDGTGGMHLDLPPALAYSRESQRFLPAQGFLGVFGYPLSSFSTKVAMGSYADVRQSLQSGRLPPPDAVHVEEMLNYFSYARSSPRDGNALGASVEVAAAPWNPSHRLVRIGVAANGETDAASGSRLAVAKDVRLEVEFNPEQAQSYRLIGYENRPPAKDRIDSKPAMTEVDAGEGVVALYEVVPVSSMTAPDTEMDPLRYEAQEGRSLAANDPRHRELLTLKIRYKLPTLDVSRKLEVPLVDTGADFSVASKDFKFAAAVAGFGMLLKESPHKGTATYAEILKWAQEGTEEGAPERKNEFIDLVRKAQKATVE